MQRASWPRILVFWKGVLGSVSSREDQTLTSSLRADSTQPYSQFLILDLCPLRMFVSATSLRAWASVPGECHGLTADLENLIRVIKRLARKLADDHFELTLSSCVSLARSAHSNGFKTGDYSLVEGCMQTTKDMASPMPTEIETYRMTAMSRYLQEQARGAQHTTR